MITFIEAAFVRSAHIFNYWQDQSTREHYIFVSDFGVLRLRKRNAYPQTFAYVQGSKLFFGYGPQSDVVSLDQPLTEIPLAVFCGEEFLTAIADCQEQTLSIQRDAPSTVPLFVGHQQGRLVISNKYERVCGLLDQTDLHPNLQTLVEHLFAEHSYDRTLVQEITVLCDRMRLSWDATGYRLHRHPGTYAQDDQTNPAQFRTRLDAVLASYWERYAGTNPMGLELSGGMDSSAIAGFCAQTHRPFLACTVVYPGQAGQYQQRKLEQLRESLRIVSEQFVADPAEEHPLVRQRKEPGPFYHREELYSASLSRMAHHLYTKGVTAVIRGIGGDELCENISDRHLVAHEVPLATHARRRQEMSPVFTSTLKAYADVVMARVGVDAQHQPFTSSTAAAAAASGSNIYLDYGIWPVAPLTDPILYRYTQNLAPRYRMHKNILRAYAVARGIPHSIARPETTEGFSDFLTRSLFYMKEQFDQCMRDSVLDRLGVLDRRYIQDAWGSGDDAFALYQILVAEMNLQHLKHRDISVPLG